MSDEVERVKITDLKPDPANANTGTERGLAALDDSLQLGLGRSVLVDKHGYLIAGNKTQARALAGGFEDAVVVRTTGDRLVVVQREDLDLLAGGADNPARRLAYYDNRVSELDLAWDAEQLLADLDAGLDLGALFSERELRDILGDDGFGEDAAAPVDQADALNETWGVQPGDLWVIESAHGGTHRLLCGDATDEADVARALDGAAPLLMVTDPPYGVAVDHAWRDRVKNRKPSPRGGGIANDDRADWRDAYRLSGAQVAYVWHAAHHASLVEAGLVEAGFAVRQQIIWVKRVHALSRSAYHWQHEPCWYAVRQGANANWLGDRRQTTVWEVASPIMSTTHNAAATPHPTEKPLELMARPIRNHTAAGDVVYDPFGGSGTTLVACERLKRQGRMLELAPKYCAVILQRLADLGLQPERRESAPDEAGAGEGAGDVSG